MTSPEPYTDCLFLIAPTGTGLGQTQVLAESEAGANLSDTGPGLDDASGARMYLFVDSDGIQWRGWS